ncbi:unnamed protein product [Meloidogyne enterolobii]|uniref:Uncharacterized protein n=1 Tax=Meloidogyne enterolobii TaxID=390850 RepID=A0ACB1A362_MELEN
MKKTTTTILSNLFYRQQSPPISLRFITTNNLTNKNSLIKLPTIKKVSGAVGALTLLYSLNILPEWRQFRDPKHYYSNLSVSPADGTVLHFGKVIDGRIECVKGQDYEINEFLGPFNINKIKENNSLYQLIIYLAPGDYHAFHSPTKWKIFEKTHFPGFYQSVRPTNLLKNPKLFCQNERIVLTGEWKFGYFSMTPVAAMFVGNIVIFDEQEKNRKLKENTKFAIKGLSVNPGEKIGEFRMGSAIVLIFEAPKNINFCIEAGQKLKYGQKLLI